MISVSLPQQIRGSFGAKLLIIMVLLISALSLLFNLLLVRLQHSSYHHHLATTGTAMASMLAESIMVKVFAEDIEGLKPPVASVLHQDHVLGVAVFNHQNEPLYYLGKKEYLGDSSGWQEMLKKLSATPELWIETKDALILRHSISYSMPPGGEEGLYFRNAGHEAAVQDIGYVVLALSPKSEQAAMKNVLSHTVFSTIVFLFFGVALTYLVVRRMTSPLSSLLRKVRASADGQDHGDDFDLLSNTFDAQFNELQETFTTISILKAELEVSNRELSADIARRKEDEATLRKRDHILRAVNKAAEELMISTEWLAFVENMIGEIGEVLSASRIRVIKNHISDDGDMLASQQYQWLNKDIASPVDEPVLENLSYIEMGFGLWLERFDDGKIFSGSVSDMSGPGAEWLVASKIKYITCAPIMVENHCWGVIGFEDWYKEQSLLGAEVEALETAARLIGAAIQRDNIIKDLAAKQIQLAHAGRLTAMGEMASGMAHEINQPLTVINLSADVCTAYFNRNFPDAPEAEAAADICVQVKKVARIVENMRIFSRRRSSEEMSPVNLASPVQDALTFFRVQFRDNQIVLTEEIAENLPEVKTDRQKFEQIVVNFLSNARYAVDKRAAMEEGFRREIDVRLYVDSLARDQLKSFGLKKKELFAEQVIMFEVEDNGIGMNEAVKNRCLEPFYTMKEVGEGTGLGLSVTHSIVKELGFYLDIESRENVGSLFRVVVPLQPDDHRG